MGNLTPFLSLGWLMGALSTREVESPRMTLEDKKAICTKGYKKKKATRRASKKARRKNRS